MIETVSSLSLGKFYPINENYVALIPENFTDEEASPLLCAGAIGYMALKLPVGIHNFIFNILIIT